MLFVQMQVWGGADNDCRTEAPVLYWWLVGQVVLFYVIVTFGLATWGSYLCAVADAQEEIAKQAVADYLQARQTRDRQMILEDGKSTEPLLTGMNN